LLTASRKRTNTTTTAFEVIVGVEEAVWLAPWLFKFNELPALLVGNKKKQTDLSGVELEQRLAKDQELKLRMP
jgi:hypothetical protein